MSLGRKSFPIEKLLLSKRRLRSRRRIKSNVNNFSLFSHNAWFKVSLLPMWRPLWFILPYQRQNIDVVDSNCSFFHSRIRWRSRIAFLLVSQLGSVKFDGLAASWLALVSTNEVTQSRLVDNPSRDALPEWEMWSHDERIMISSVRSWVERDWWWGKAGLGSRVERNFGTECGTLRIH